MVDVSKRLRVSEDLARRLSSETALVRTCLERGDIISQAEEDDVQVPFLDTLADRFKRLHAAGLFFARPDSGGEINWTELVLAQAEIARVHGLSYKKSGSSSAWIQNASPPNPDETPSARGHGYFSSIFEKQNRSTLSRLDLALLAHCYQTPLAVIETRKTDVFDAYFEELATGVDLFGHGVDFLFSRVVSNPVLSVIPEGQIPMFFPDLGRQERGFVIDPPRPDLTELIVNQAFAILAPLDGEFERTVSACVIGTFGETWELLSRRSLSGGQSIFPSFLTLPRLERLGQTGHTLRFDTVGEFTVLLIAGNLNLDAFPAFKASDRIRSAHVNPCSLSSDDFDWLRQHLLSHAPDAYRVLTRTVVVGPGGHSGLQDLL